MNGENFALDQVSGIDVGHRYFVFQVVNDGDAVVFRPQVWPLKQIFLLFKGKKHGHVGGGHTNLRKKILFFRSNPEGS